MKHSKAYVFDVDGTLALRHPDRGPYDFEDAGRDMLNRPVWDVLANLYFSGLPILIVTGRPEKYWEVTDRWLEDNGVPFTELFMRWDGDNRPDHEVKRDILKHSILPHWEVAGVFDDRDSVVKMWREEGITCFQVAEGNF